MIENIRIFVAAANRVVEFLEFEESVMELSLATVSQDKILSLKKYINYY